MATLNAANPTLADLAKLRDPDGSPAEVVRIMDEINEGLQLFSFVEGNLPTGHRTTISASIPKPTWRRLYGGVAPNKGARVQVDDNCGMLEAYGVIDKALVEVGGTDAERAAIRLQEDYDHIEGLSQELMHAIFYESEATNPERITGLAPRYSSKSAGNGRNIILADPGASGGDQSSIWLVVSGPMTVTGITPKGSVAGIQVEDRGQQTYPEDSTQAGPQGRMFEAMVTHYKVNAGICVKNWKYAVRICNIDKTNTWDNKAVRWSDGQFAANMVNLPDVMSGAIDLIPNIGRGRPAFYMSRQLKTVLRKQLSAQTNESSLTKSDVGGRPIMGFMDIPVAICDALDTAEAVVS